MSEEFDEKIMAYLTQGRMASLGNLAGHFEYSVEDFTPIVLNLQSQGRVRFSASRCQSDCGSCHSSCGDGASSALNERTIVISLERPGGIV